MKVCPSCHREFFDELEFCPLDEADLVEADGQLPPDVGEVVGHYRLLSQIGEGGMSRLFVAGHTSLNRYVAIKKLKAKLEERGDMIVRFFDEASAVNAIKHPNIVEVIDLVEDPFSGAYCVLELINGIDLRSRVDAAPIALESVLAIGAQIADAIAAVHGVGIVHRDLKPENVMLIERAGREDFVKLIDFGVAQMSDEQATGIPFGTAAYMSPEQAAGRRVDGRSDVYSLGVVLYEMIAGRHPFPSDSDNEYLIRHADDPVPRLPRRAASGEYVPESLDRLVRRCLAKDPADRFESAGALAVAMRGGVDLDAPRRGGKLVAAIGALVLAGGAAAIMVVRAQEPAASPRATASVTAVPQRSIDASQQTASPEPTTPPDAAVVDAQDAEEIVVTFRSDPPGAEVIRAGETVPLGTTPFEERFAASERTARVEFRLDGHEPVQIEVSMRASDEVSVTLLQAAKTEQVRRRARTSSPRRLPRKASKKAPSKSQNKSNKATRIREREGVVDPFAR